MKAKIIKKGTFSKEGAPTGWTIAPGQDEEIDYCLGVIDDKVFVNGVEIEEWTKERKKMMNE